MLNPMVLLLLPLLHWLFIPVTPPAMLDEPSLDTPTSFTREMLTPMVLWLLPIHLWQCLFTQIIGLQRLGLVSSLLATDADQLLWLQEGRRGMLNPMVLLLLLLLRWPFIPVTPPAMLDEPSLDTPISFTREMLTRTVLWLSAMDQ